jgi:hypothetical protein
MTERSERKANKHNERTQNDKTKNKKRQKKKGKEAKKRKRQLPQTPLLLTRTSDLPDVLSNLPEPSFESKSRDSAGHTRSKTRTYKSTHGTIHP